MINNQFIRVSFMLPILMCISQMSFAFEISAPMKTCLLEQILISSPETKVGELTETCRRLLDIQNTQVSGDQSAIKKRIANEISIDSNPNAIASHKRSYFLPLTYVDDPNAAPFNELGEENLLDNLEAKFQLSFKVPLFNDIFTKNDVIHAGFTIQSYWQMYNSKLSSPFRETNYQPEIFYSMLNDWQIGDWTNQVVTVGIEHQSNGRSQELSRSWNRIYTNFIFEKKNWVISFKPWYRIPEKNKIDPNQPDGDDNPDIGKFMGNFELTTIYQWNDQNISLMLRNNLRSNNRGALQFDWTFPLGKKFKGYVQYFGGYGESLIDYNHYVQRLGVGILLTDFL